MKIRNHNSYQEIQQLVKLSVSKYEIEWFPADELYSVHKLFNHINSGGYFRVVEQDGSPVAWGAALIGHPYLHSKKSALTQTYYHSVASGVQGYRAMVTFHEDMISYARDHKCDYTISGSILENSNTFNEILKKNGWTKVGSFMLFDNFPS